MTHFQAEVKRLTAIKRREVVYFIQSWAAVKIGVTHDLKSRVADLNVGNPFESKVLFTIKADDAYELERNLHKLFSEKRVKGEWFALDEVDYYNIIREYVGNVTHYNKPFFEENRHNVHVLKLKLLNQAQEIDRLKSQLEKITLAVVDLSTVFVPYGIDKGMLLSDAIKDDPQFYWHVLREMDGVMKDEYPIYYKSLRDYFYGFKDIFSQ